MVAIYPALGLFRQGGFGLAEGGRTWFASRVLVNDQVQPLEFCGGEESEGICELGAFADSQSYARENGQGDWEACVENVLCIPVFIQVYCTFKRKYVASLSPRIRPLDKLGLLIHQLLELCNRQPLPRPCGHSTAERPLVQGRQSKNMVALWTLNARRMIDDAASTTGKKPKRSRWSLAALFGRPASPQPRAPAARGTHQPSPAPQSQTASLSPTPGECPSSIC